MDSPTLKQHLAQHSKTLHITDKETASALRSAADVLGFVIFEVDVSTIGSEADLMDALATEMAFPDYFGRNWDAVDECLRDFSWRPAQGYLVIVQGSDSLASTLPDEARLLLDSFVTASDFWAKENVPFHAVLVGDRAILSPPVETAALGSDDRGCIHD